MVNFGALCIFGPISIGVIHPGRVYFIATCPDLLPLLVQIFNLRNFQVSRGKASDSTVLRVATGSMRQVLGSIVLRRVNPSRKIPHSTLLDLQDEVPFAKSQGVLEQY